MKNLMIAVLVLALGGAGGFKYLTGQDSLAQELPESSMATVRTGSMKITVTENGYLKAKNSEEIKPKFKGGSQVTWLIEEGEEVVEGDILAEFDKTELERRIDDLENQMIQYEAELEAAQSSLAIQERDSNAGIEKAELQLELRGLELERYEKGDMPNEKRKKILAFEKATSEFGRAMDRFEQVPELEKEGFLTKIQVEEERIKLREAEIGEENAKRDLELYNTYTVAMELKQKNASLKDAQRELQNSREKATISLKEKQARVTQKERQISQTEDRLNEQKEERDHHTVKSPGSGIVYYGNPDQNWMRDQIKVGNHLSSGHTLFTLPDLREMQVLIQIHEADIARVKVGMPASVSVETNKGEVFDGEVTDIATVATAQSWTDDSNKTFRVELTMQKSETELRAGVTSKVEIHVAEFEDVLQVPIHAVFPEGGSHFCFVYADGKIKKTSVEVGRNNSHRVEVKSGVAEGDRVLLYDPRLDSEVGAEEAGSEAEDGGLSSGLAGMGEDA